MDVSLKITDRSASNSTIEYVSTGNQYFEETSSLPGYCSAIHTIQEMKTALVSIK
jgi:hypothetical protein